jgi:hypothetical protein
VVEDRSLFDAAYPNLILVPLAEDPHLAIEDLSIRIPPTPENGCSKPCHALAHHVTTRIVLLLGGGDKSTQDADIVRAVNGWNDWKRRPE